MKPERLSRATISAKYLLADAPAATDLYMPAELHLTAGFVIHRYAAKVARGAYKPKMANRGDAPTTSHAANRDGRIMGNSQHSSVRKLAARGY